MVYDLDGYELDLIEMMCKQFMCGALCDPQSGDASSISITVQLQVQVWYLAQFFGAAINGMQMPQPHVVSCDIFMKN